MRYQWMLALGLLALYFSPPPVRAAEITPLVAGEIYKAMQFNLTGLSEAPNPTEILVVVDQLASKAEGGLVTLPVAAARVVRTGIVIPEVGQGIEEIHGPLAKKALGNLFHKMIGSNKVYVRLQAIRRDLHPGAVASSQEVIAALAQFYEGGKAKPINTEPSETIAFLGAAGNVGATLIPELLKRHHRVTGTRGSRDGGALNALRTKFPGLRVTVTNPTAVEGASIVILAVQPQDAPLVLRDIAGVIRPDQLIVSVVADLTTDAIMKELRVGSPVVRVVLNALSLFNAGTIAIAPGARASEGHLKVATSLFRPMSIGHVVVVPESTLAAVQGLSVAGPALVARIITALTDAGVKMGLELEIATRLVLQTVMATARLLYTTKNAPDSLESIVATQGSTAEQGLHVFDERDLSKIIQEAVAAATRHAKKQEPR